MSSKSANYCAATPSSPTGQYYSLFLFSYQSSLCLCYLFWFCFQCDRPQTAGLLILVRAALGNCHRYAGVMLSDIHATSHAFCRLLAADERIKRPPKGASAVSAFEKKLADCDTGFHSVMGVGETTPNEEQCV